MCYWVLSLILKSLSWFQTRSPSKAASMFSGTQEKCATCGKTAYPLEKVTIKILRFPKVSLLRYSTWNIALNFDPVADSECSSFSTSYNFPLFLVQPWQSGV
jgi:ribosomal protein L37E